MKRRVRINLFIFIIMHLLCLESKNKRENGPTRTHKSNWGVSQVPSMSITTSGTNISAEYPQTLPISDTAGLSKGNNSK